MALMAKFSTRCGLYMHHCILVLQSPFNQSSSNGGCIRCGAVYAIGLKVSGLS
jgi:hypothetical protein